MPAFRNIQAKEDAIVNTFKWFDGDFIGFGILHGKVFSCVDFICPFWLGEFSYGQCIDAL
jgi:hypothetical protein